MLSNNIPIFVINLDASRDRWTSVQTRCQELDLELHRVGALDGRSLNRENWSGFDALEFRKHTGRIALPGEYGCYRSHLRALQRFLDHGAEYGLIIEDDVLPNSKTAPRLAALIEEVAGFEVIRLVSHRSNGFMSFKTTRHGDRVGRTIFGPQGSAAAYLVSREGAEKIMAALATMILPWDVALERFWHSTTEMFSTQTNVLEFSSHRADSSIISKGGYSESKLPWTNRFSAFAFQLGQGFSRAHAVLPVPKLAQQMPPRTMENAPATQVDVSQTVGAITIGCFMVFLSSLWVESDAYRFAGVAMVLAALVHYFRRDFLTYSKALIGPMGIICALWAIYVAGRMGIDYVTRPGKGMGTAEGIYLLPILYPTFGYAIFLGLRRPLMAVVCFMAISLAVLMAGTDYSQILAGERARTFLHNNSIHAANAAGILFICAAAFGSFVLHHSEMGGKVRSVLLLLAAGVLLLSGLNVLSLQSKGVWVSIAASLVVLLFMLLASRRGARPWLIYLAALVGLAAGVVIFGQSIRSVGEKTAGGAAALVTRVLSGESPSLVMSSAIADPATDPSIADRLMIWANGAEVWQSHPIFGAGVTWLDNWENRIYPTSTFTLLHNGYLEIAVRYGLFGLLFYGVMFAWSLITVRKAAMARLIDVSAYQAHLAVMILFAISLFTNSNNRLAFGESYMWFAASFGFYCHYLLQRQGLVRVRTYF